MKSLSIRKEAALTIGNVKCDERFCLKVDGVEYEIPYRIESVIDFEDTLIVLTCPIYPIDDCSKFKQEGQPSLYAIDKKSKNVIWTKKRIWNVWERYNNYDNGFQNRKIIYATTDNFEIVIDVKTGEEIGSSYSK